jgi:hypothetical protein
VHQRVALIVQSGQPRRRPVARAGLDDDAGAADGGHVVARGAAVAVEGGAEAVFRRLDFGEVRESQPELRELRRRDAGQRIAWEDGALCGRHQRRGDERDA